MSGFHWLAAYPKSGHTWLRLGLWSLRRGEPPDMSRSAGFAPVVAARDFFDDTLHVDSTDLTRDEIARLRPRQYEREAAASAEPLFRKVHDAWTPTPAGEPLFPPAVTLGVVYIVRDPRDVAVSMAYHLDRTLDAAIAFLNQPDAKLGGRFSQNQTQFVQHLLSWSAHVESWLGAPGPAPLLVRYEDMAAGAGEQLKRVAAYLGWTAADAAVAAAVDATRFQALRAAEERHGFEERLPHMNRFFRRGVAGGWCDSLTRAQAARIEADHGRVMARLGYL